MHQARGVTDFSFVSLGGHMKPTRTSPAPFLLALDRFHNPQNGFHQRPCGDRRGASTPRLFDMRKFVRRDGMDGVSPRTENVDRRACMGRANADAARGGRCLALELRVAPCCSVLCFCEQGAVAVHRRVKACLTLPCNFFLNGAISLLHVPLCGGLKASLQHSRYLAL